MHELKTQLVDINEQIKAIEFKADQEGRDLTPAEDAEAVRLLNKFKGIDAELKNGVLVVHLPKSERIQPRKVEVRAG